MYGVSSTKSKSPIYSSKSFIYANLSGDQSSNLTATSHLEFDTLVEGNLTLSTGSGQDNGKITLAGGTRYLIQCSVNAVLSAAGSYATLQLYDITNTTYFGSTIELYPQAHSATNTSSGNILLGVITPENDIQVEVRVKTLGSGTITSIDSDATFVLVEAIEGYTNISLTDWDYAAFTNATNTFTQAQTFQSRVTFSDNVNFSFPTITSSSGTATADWTDANKQKITLTENVTLSFTNPTGACNVLLMVVQDATGSRTLTLPSGIKWPGGTAPTLSTGANDIDILSFFYDGSTYYGAFNIDFTT